VPDVSGFFSGPFSTAGAFGVYDQTLVTNPPGAAINGTGEFFSFQLTAASVGTGSILFNDASGFDSLGNVIYPTLGNSLTVKVVGATAVPLPSVCWSGLVLLVTIGLLRFLRRRAVEFIALGATSRRDITPGDGAKAGLGFGGCGSSL